MTDWNGFRVLLAVVERGSFSAAARALGISQPTVGRHVAALEDALGARLVLRRKKGVALTSAGEQIIEDVRRMAQAASDASRRSAQDTQQVEGTVRISCTESIGVLWLTDRLLSLRARHTKLRIDLSIDNASVDLSKREADLAIRLVRPRQPGLVARRFGTLAFGLFASPAYLDARGTPRTIKDLARHDLIGMSERGITPPYWAWLKRLVPRERFVFSASGLLAQQEAARAGWGIVVGPTYLLATDARLRRVLPRVSPPGLDLWLVVHEDVRKSARIRVVHDAIAQMLAQESLGFGGA